jgi:hypothetical protein
MSETWLSPEEVAELTARMRWSAQCRALAAMGVPFTPNAVGRPLVERAVVCKGSTNKPRAKRGPNMEALHGKAA